MSAEEVLHTPDLFEQVPEADAAVPSPAPVSLAPDTSCDASHHFPLDTPRFSVR